MTETAIRTVDDEAVVVGHLEIAGEMGVGCTNSVPA
jgi:hypothetical protein